MDFSLNEQQEMLRKMSRDFFTAECPKSLVREMAEDEKGFPAELWKKMVELEWMGLAFPDEYGGLGGSFLDLCVLLEEMGRACLPGPFFSDVVLGGLTLLEAGNESQKKAILPEIAQGNRFLTLAFTELSGKYTPDGIQAKASQNADGYTIDGTKMFVPDAHLSDQIICLARTKEGISEDGISLFLIDAKTPGITITPLKTIAGDKQCEVVFEKVKVPQAHLIGEIDQGWEYIKKLWPKIVIAQCAEMVGGAQQALEMAVDYAKERVQFGRPIGSFQAIQHYCANMAADVDGSRFITYQAAWMLDEGIPCNREVAIAKAFVSEAFHRVTVLAQQIHGALAFCVDHDLPLYYMRAKAWELTLGDSDFHREAVAQEIGL